MSKKNKLVDFRAVREAVRTGHPDHPRSHAIRSDPQDPRARPHRHRQPPPFFPPGTWLRGPLTNPKPDTQSVGPFSESLAIETNVPGLLNAFDRTVGPSIPRTAP